MHKKIILTFLTASILGLSACSGSTPHEHTFDDNWSSNETDHWHAATCEHTDLTKDLAHHVDENKDGKCDICGNPYHVHEHTYKESWSYDNNHHWHAATCEHKDLTKDYGNHVDENRDHICDVCNFRHPNALTITKQPGIVHANYPESATMTVEVNDPSQIVYTQWQYYIGIDYEGRPRFRDLEGGIGQNTLSLELPSIRQKAGDFLIFRCELADLDGVTLFTEPGQFVVDNKKQNIDVGYFADFAIKAGETLDLEDTPYGSGTISLNSEGDVYTFNNVNATYKDPYTSHNVFDNMFVIDSDTNTHEQITINLVGDNFLNNPFWNAEYNAGHDVLSTYFGSKCEQAKLVINGPGNITLKGGSRALYSDGELEINADIRLEGFHYRLSNGINSDSDILIKSNSHITGYVGGYGISASSVAKLTVEDDAEIDLDIFGGKVYAGDTSIYGLTSSDTMTIGKAKVTLDFIIDTNIYSADSDYLSLTALISHNTEVLLNGSDVKIDIKTSGEPLGEYFYITTVRGIKSPFIGLNGAKLDIDIDAKEAEKVYGLACQASQIINNSSLNIDGVGGLETYGIFSNTNQNKDGVKIHNSNVSINMSYSPYIKEEEKICLFGIATMLYDISLNESSTVTLNTNDQGTAFGVIIDTGFDDPVGPIPSYVPVALKEEGYVVEEAHSININSFKSKKYVIYETFVDTSALLPLASVTLSQAS